MQILKCQQGQNLDFNRMPKILLICHRFYPSWFLHGWSQNIRSMSLKMPPQGFVKMWYLVTLQKTQFSFLRSFIFSQWFQSWWQMIPRTLWKIDREWNMKKVGKRSTIYMVYFGAWFFWGCFSRNKIDLKYVLIFFHMEIR